MKSSKREAAEIKGNREEKESDEEDVQTKIQVKPAMDKIQEDEQFAAPFPMEPTTETHELHHRGSDVSQALDVLDPRLCKPVALALRNLTLAWFHRHAML